MNSKRNCPRCAMFERKSEEATESVIGPHGAKMDICKRCVEELKEENKFHEIKENEGTLGEIE